MADGFAVAIHGGAGVISKDIPADKRQEYIDSLRSILEQARDDAASGMRALDVAERAVRLLEDDPNFNAGRGSVYCEDGSHELEASIMCGRTLQCGAVAELKTVRNPISLARLVMERTPHIFLAGRGAEQFAHEMHVERVDPDWFDTERRRMQLEEALAERARSQTVETQRSITSPIEDAGDDECGTVGCVVLDSFGDLAAATSTGGRTAKRVGRIGDTPMIGAGNYANNRSCAVSGTGVGESFIRHCTARDIAALIEYGNRSLHDAAHHVIHERMSPGDGGVIAVSARGEIAMIFNSTGMFRGAADSDGRFEVGIWEATET